ncbi:MAG: ACGX-repeat peptide [Planctomycetota bacterium]|jgi:hypothetical protein|nr:ACGX-repeat peptide [Planctomycetota bacterium]
MMNDREIRTMKAGYVSRFYNKSPYSGGKQMSKLNVLNDWANRASAFSAIKSAQSYLCPAMAEAASCGSSCGAGDDKPAEPPNPGACGSACGTGDDKPAEPPKEKSKPSACGSACGASDQK